MPIAKALKSRAAVVTSVLLLRSLGSGVLALALPLYVTSIGRSAAQWGVLVSAYALAMIPAEPVWGRLSDRFGIARPFLLSQIVSALFYPVFMLTNSMGGLFAAQMMRGALEVSMGPLGRQACVRCLGRGQSAMGLGLFQASLTLGQAIGSLLGGFMIERLGYSAAFIVSSTLWFGGFLLMVANRSKLRALDDADPAATATASEMPGAVGVVHDRSVYFSFFALGLIGLFLFAGFGVQIAFVPLLGTTVLGLQTSQVGLVLTSAGVLSGVLALLSARLSERVGRRPIIVGGLLLMGICLLGYGSANGMASLAILCVFFSMGVVAVMPSTAAWVLDIVPASQRGQLIGLYGSFENVGYMLGPLLCGALWTGLGARVALRVCGLIVAAGIVPAFLVRGRQPKGRRNEDPGHNLATV